LDITALATVVLSDPDATGHRIGDLWSEGPVVLAFLRHFG